MLAYFSFIRFVMSSWRVGGSQFISYSPLGILCCFLRLVKSLLWEIMLKCFYNPRRVLDFKWLNFPTFEFSLKKYLWLPCCKFLAMPLDLHCDSKKWAKIMHWFNISTTSKSTHINETFKISIWLILQSPCYTIFT